MQRSRWARGVYALGLLFAAGVLFDGDPLLVTAAFIAMATMGDLRWGQERQSRSVA